MKLQSKIFIPVILSLIVLGGSMYLLNRQVLKESYNSEIQKVLSDKENSFSSTIENKISSILQYSNILANSTTMRSAFIQYNQSSKIDTVWTIINAEVDRIKFGAISSKQKPLTINCYAPPGVVVFRSRSDKKEPKCFY